MQQETLFHEELFDALRTDISRLGGNKVVGHLIWPKLFPDKAGEKLANCLSRTRQEKLDPEEVLFIQKDAAQIADRLQRLGG